MKRRILAAAFATLVISTSANADEYNLTIDRQDVDVGGRHGESLTINGQLPGPTLHFKEGEQVTIHVTNKLKEDTSLHWHGLLLPGDMDGVPDFNNFPGIKPDQTFTYSFKVRQSGTYWYHSHSGGQEQEGLYGPIVIDPAGGEIVKTDRDYVVTLSDFTTEKPETILNNLKGDSGYYNYSRRTMSDFFRDVDEKGFGATVKDRLAWGDMRMDPTDLADVSGYTFLINGKSEKANWTGLFKPGERVRLRFINASAMTYFDLRIPGLKMILVAADGQNVQPVVVDEIRMAIAETYDVIVTPRDDKAYTIFAQSLDRTGYARGTLAPRNGMEAAVPPIRARSLLTMADMGMGDMSMDHTDMSGMDMSGMSMDNAHDMHKPKTSKKEEDQPMGWNSGAPSSLKVLSYADLKSLKVQPDTRKATREIIVHLGGNMERYIWTLNGKKYADAKPIELKYGERVKLTFINDTMMAHPMHLHGMFVQLVNGQPADRLPNKHIVSVPPGQSYSVMLTADEAGEWAFHCHLLYHMESGMMRKVVVARLRAEAAQ
ncbi:MAG: copper resistance system multicopper oxidase [Parvibaculum sp.]